MLGRAVVKRVLAFVVGTKVVVVRWVVIGFTGFAFKSMKFSFTLTFKV